MFFYDFKAFKIGNFSKILVFSDTVMRLLLQNNNIIEINGANLFISFYDKQEIIIEGKVNNINIKYENI